MWLGQGRWHCCDDPFSRLDQSRVRPVVPRFGQGHPGAKDHSRQSRPRPGTDGGCPVLRSPASAALVLPTQVPARAAQYITCASNIDLAMYELGNPALIHALIAAHKRGASVKVLLDATERQSAVSGRQLAPAGIPVRYVHVPGGIDHVKLLAINGGAAVLTGGVTNKASSPTSFLTQKSRTTSSSTRTGKGAPRGTSPPPREMSAR